MDQTGSSHETDSTVTLGADVLEQCNLEAWFLSVHLLATICALRTSVKDAFFAHFMDVEMTEQNAHTTISTENN